jgi:opacity protein-like surface antigen
MKKTLLLSLLLASSAATALAADNAKISGKWKIHIDVQGTENDVTCDFTQKDTDLTGSCTTDKGDKPLTGKVDGKTIKFQYDAEYEGTPYTAKYSGGLDSTGAKFAGAIVIDAFGADGDFTGVPEK